MNRTTTLLRLLVAASSLLVFAAPGLGFAQTGVDDDRVSLPEGPGSLEGVGDDVEIDPNMGSMSFSIPIELPNGFPNASPELTLKYSSGASAGPVGIGWSLNTPVIARMTSRGVPTYTTDDFIDVDSAELVLVDDSDPDELVYRKRFESDFKRYRWISSNGGADGYWVVDHPDGTRSYYGADRNGQIIDTARSAGDEGTARYLLRETVDVWGHYVRYEYRTDFGDGENSWPLLERVSWIEDGSGFLLYTAELTYEARPDFLSDASVGFEELLTRRLSTVTVRADSEIVRQYHLGYEDDASAGGFSRLTSVERYGLGGKVTGAKPNPNIFSFAYSRALGAECDDTTMDCDDKPRMVSMGTIAGAVDISNGKATLIDIDGDGLSDILDTTDPNGHVFFVNTLDPDDSGGFTQRFADGTTSSLSDATMQLSEAVQVFDVNGDGLSDLLNTINGNYLLNTLEAADWGSSGSLSVDGTLVGVDFNNAKFIDIDDNKRVDILIGSSSTTQVYYNMGDEFETAQVEPLGAAVGGTSTLQFADMNGDGLNDPVQIDSSGNISYRLNLGRGRWSEGWKTISGLYIESANRSLVDLEDLNGDGLSDVVLVTGAQVKYAINRNGNRFDDFETITTASLGTGTIPDRTNKTVLYADMNANGSEDVVWFTKDGKVDFLELFPTRPNLLTRIENGLGFVQNIEYSTAAEQAALARVAGNPWTHTLPIAMQVVESADIFVTLTGADDGSGLHAVTTYTYRDGFYDGLEKQYRGFEDVEMVVVGDEFQESSTTHLLFDVGRELPWRNGLGLVTRLSGEDSGFIKESTNTYEACAVAEVPTPEHLETLGRKGVYWPCKTAIDTVLAEGQDESAWIRLREETVYDGYGNTIEAINLGNVDVEGDEDYTKTTYVERDDSHWLIQLPVKELHSALADYSDANEKITYYDGDDFVGLPEGQATHGFVTRMTTRASADHVIETERHRRDEHGNSVEKLDPNATIEGTGHRRTYDYDPTGLFLTVTDIQVDDYVLRRESVYEQNFQQLVEVTKWMLVDGAGTIKTARNSNRYTYDEFGRLRDTFMAGDTRANQRLTFELGLTSPEDPGTPLYSRIVIQRRSVRDGDFDEQVIQCFDGKGRTYQQRTRLGAGSYLVTGLKEFNRLGREVRVYAPYVSSSDQCDDDAPEGTLYATTRYDADNREIESTEPGEGLYGERLATETRYLPLVEEHWDAEDLDESGPHAGTPLIKEYDGLGRPVGLVRTWNDETGTLQEARTRLLYDTTNTFSGYEDAAGNRHALTVDLAERIVAVENPATGLTTYAYDDAGNPISMTDARGVTLVTEYDDVNRIKARYDATDRDGTLIEWFYDVVPEGCEFVDCTNVTGKVASLTWPLDLGNGRTERGQDRLGYDLRDQEVYRARRFGSLTDLVTRFTFDNQSRITSITHPDGTVVSTEYDLAGREIAIPGYVSAIAYEDRGLWQAMEMANGTMVTRTFDDLIREDSRTVTDGAQREILGLSMTRNRVGGLIGIEDTAFAANSLLGNDPSMSVQYTRDDWYRVRGADFTDAGETLSWEYDALDRILSATSSDESSVAHIGAYTYDEARPLVLQAAGSLAMNHDEAGQLVGRAGVTMTRDEMGRISSVELAGGDRAWMAYAHEYRSAQFSDADGTMVLYAPTNDLFEIRDGIARTYVKLDRDFVALEESTSLATSIYPNPDGDDAITAYDAYRAHLDGDTSVAPVMVLGAAAARALVDEEASPTHFLHTDALGSILASSDLGGELRGRRAYYPFGQTRFETGYVDVRGFTGQEHDDASTGLIHMDKREYDPVTGRWDRFDPFFFNIQAEMMEQLGEATTGYAYTANNPLDLTDPTGTNTDNKKAAKKAGPQKQKSKLTGKKVGKFLLKATFVALTLPNSIIGFGAKALIGKLAGNARGNQINLALERTKEKMGISVGEDGKDKPGSGINEQAYEAGIANITNQIDKGTKVDDIDYKSVINDIYQANDIVSGVIPQGRDRSRHVGGNNGLDD